MHILDSASIRAWDQFTIEHEPIASIDLMERAALTCTEWLMHHGYKGRQFAVFCGKGNNGGDGLAIARQLLLLGQKVDVFIVEHGHKGTPDFQENLARLHPITTAIHFISGEESIHPVAANTVVIDAIFGSGLNKPVIGLEKYLIEFLNKARLETISVDLPSGLYADDYTYDAVVINATHTLSFQCYKSAFLAAENANSIGELHVLDIGLHKEYLLKHPPAEEFISIRFLQTFYKARPAFSHKGLFGHAALFAGSKGMMGAATLAATACMRSGVGKLTSVLPEIGYTIMQIASPESMCVVAGTDKLEYLPELSNYDAIGIGPGIGNLQSHENWLRNLLSTFRGGLVLDADALNVLSANKSLLQQLPASTIITPHPGEFDRLFGKSSNSFERMKKAREKANALNIVIVLKGRYTMVATPSGRVFFNNTGNAGMAKAGNGDVLTGIILALLAQGYSSEQASLLGVFVHGKAADLAIVNQSEESLLPTDTVEKIGAAFRTIR